MPKYLQIEVQNALIVQLGKTLSNVGRQVEHLLSWNAIVRCDGMESQHTVLQAYGRWPHDWDGKLVLCSISTSLEKLTQIRPVNKMQA